MKKIMQHLIETTERFIPKNWKILCPQYIEEHDPISCQAMLGRGTPNTLYLILFIMGSLSSDDIQECERLDDRESWIGQNHGPMRFRGKNIATQEIWLRNVEPWPGDVYFETLVYELAHVAVRRWHSWQMKKRYGKRPCLIGAPHEGDEPMHGPMFQKAFERIISRAEETLGKSALAECREELWIYKLGGRSNGDS